MIWYVGMFGTFAAAAVALYYKPDTRCAFHEVLCGSPG